MRCPKCGAENQHRVIDTRPVPGEEMMIRRRRKCLVCDHRWNTFEVRASKLNALMGGSVRDWSAVDVIMGSKKGKK